MSYPGGKAGPGVYQVIINHIPPHRVYIEPFLGGGAIMKMKAPSSISIGVDTDRQALDAFPKDCQPGLTLIHDDARHFLKNYSWTGQEFIYCDPPYLLEVRRKKARIYTHEFSSPGQHLELLSLLREIPAACMISGYPSTLYQDLLPDWPCITFLAGTRSGFQATECLWMNYPPPTFLHDYRYLGRDFRERERIKRRQHRWKRRLVMMPPLERAALIMAIQDPRIPSP